MGWLKDLFRNRNDPNGIQTVVAEAPGIDGLLEYENGQWVIKRGESKYSFVDLYKLTLARECINKIATECSKARPELRNPNRKINYIVAKYPNEYQTCSQFLYQLVTMLMVDNNAFIIPIYDEKGNVSGLWPASKDDVTVGEIDGRLWVIYHLEDGTEYPVEYAKCGHLKQMQYRHKIFGDDNGPFKKAAELYEENLDKTINAVIDGSQPIRWKGKLNVPVNSMADLKEQQKWLYNINVIGNKTGIFVYDGRFESLEEVTKDYKLINAEDMDQIKKDAYEYWGVSSDILQNKYTEDTWNGFYQSRIEPVLDQIGEVLTKILYSRRAIIYNDDEVLLTSNKLQYASIKTRKDIAFGIVDRGMGDLNHGLEILNLPPLPDEQGKYRFIRGEYKDPEGKEVVYGREDNQSTGLQSNSETGDETAAE
jgi:hypothetical protein